MTQNLILIFFIGSLGGYALGFIYKSIGRKRPFHLGVFNAAIYGFAAVFIYLVHLSDFNPTAKLILIALIPTLLELIFGLFFQKINYQKMWNYSRKKFNYKGIICLEFSFYWIILSILGYCFLIPLVANNLKL